MICNTCYNKTSGKDIFIKEWALTKPGGLDLSRRDLDRDLDLHVQKISVSTVEKILTVFKS